MKNQAQAGHVYFILPIYNEEAALASLLATLSAVPLPNGRTIVAVNDGSKDRSAEILKDGESRCPLRVLTHSPNRGIPAVFKSAFEYVVPLLQDNDVVIFMESDGTSNPALIPALVERVGAGDDVVIGSRHAPGGGYLRFPWYRVMASSVVNICLALSWRLPGVKDYTIFYRAYSGSILKKGFGKGVNFNAAKSFAANGEILLILAPHHPRAAEVPLRYDYGKKRGPSAMPLIPTLIEYIRLSGMYSGNRR